jgi:hypothetical protein
VIIFLPNWHDFAFRPSPGMTVYFFAIFYCHVSPDDTLSAALFSATSSKAENSINAFSYWMLFSLIIF